MQFEKTSKAMAPTAIYKLAVLTQGSAGKLSLGKQALDVVLIRPDVYVTSEKIDARFKVFAFAEGKQILSIQKSADFQQLKDQLKEYDYATKKDAEPSNPAKRIAKAGSAKRPSHPIRDESSLNNPRRGN